MEDKDFDINNKTKEEANIYYSVKNSQDFGRYLIASQDIPERTKILQEFPIVYAPADEIFDSNNSIIFCLSCCIQLKRNDLFEICQFCRWPLCKLCQKMTETVHGENECRIIQQNPEQRSFPPPSGWSLFYKSILILRILLLIKEKDASTWTKFFSLLEHHNNETRSKKAHCVKADAMIIQNMKYFLKNTKEENLLDFDLIQILIGIVNVNAFGSTKGNNTQNENFRKTKSMYQEASLFAHSCSPNCYWNINLIPNNYKPQIEIITSIPIKAGELLTIPYNTRHLFYGTLKRQIMIESIAHFDCKCIRCQSPDELGTFMSSLRCFKCEMGFLTSKNTTFQDSDWECKLCGATETVEKIVDFVTDVEEYFDKIQDAHLDWEKELDLLQKLFKKHHGHLFHPNHYTLQEISTRILELIVEVMKEVSLDQVDIFLWHCDYLKRIADVILPGYNGYQEQLMDYKIEGQLHKQNALNFTSR